MTAKLESLFRVYASDLAHFAPQLTGRFGCPLCYRAIGQTADLREVVAEEHIVPRALGGRIVTLTCRKCNSGHGTKLDAHLVQRVKVEAGRLPLPVRMGIGEGEHGAQLYLPKSDDDPFEIVGVPKQSDLRKMEAARRALESGEKEIHMRIKLGYNHLRSLVGLLRAAYLLMFRYFGYRYVLDSSARPIQWQIQHPLESTAALNGIMWRISDPVLTENVVTIVEQPQEFQCFFVILQLDAGTKHYAGVALPPLGQDGAEFYKRLQSPSAGDPQRLVVVRRPNRQFLPMVAVWEHYTRTT